MEPDIAFGRALRAARKSARMSQEHLALTAGVQRNYVSLLERGLSSPSLRMVFKLCAVLRLRPSELIAETEREIRS